MIAAALLIGLFSSAMTIILVGIALIVIFKVVVAAFFAATAVKAYFSSVDN